LNGVGFAAKEMKSQTSAWVEEEPPLKGLFFLATFAIVRTKF